jgi:hypothetical protein
LFKLFMATSAVVQLGVLLPLNVGSSEWILVAVNVIGGLLALYLTFSED